MILGVILARGGSKRLPGKNLRPFRGRPLIDWTIQQAREARTLDKIVLSSDSTEILAQAGRFPIQLVVRPDELAADDASSYDAINHAVENWGGPLASHVCLLQPTSPNRTSWDIDATVGLGMAAGRPTCSADELGRPLQPNGAVYFGSVGWLRGGGNWDEMFWSATHFMPPERSHDIDTLEDFEAAEKAA